MKVSPAATLTGVERTSSCQPVGVSFVNTSSASTVPDAFQTRAWCVPRFVGDFANNTLVMVPETELVTRTPRFTGLASGAGWKTVG